LARRPSHGHGDGCGGPGCRRGDDRRRLGRGGHELSAFRRGPARVRVIAIDGPAGSGKSTVARTLAARLGLDYLDSGAMYRSVTFAALRRGIDAADADKVAAVARDLDMEIAEQVIVDGADATRAIRRPDGGKAVRR